MKVTVLFRKSHKGEIIAVFPETPATRNPSECVAYSRVSKHAACSIAYARLARPADTSEARALLRELKRLDYDLRIVSRFHPKQDERRRANLSAMLR